MLADERIAIDWTDQAKADVRAIDRVTAMLVLQCLDHYSKWRTGDVKALQRPLTGYRLRCGDYRLFFDLVSDQGMLITRVRHRREAYRA